MKRLLLGSVAVAALFAIGAAQAADLPRPAPAPVYKAPAVVPAPVFSWTGFYIGANVGVAWDHLRATDVSDYFSPGGITTLNHTGIFGGGTLGYNQQFGTFVAGLEVDLGGMDLGASTVPTGAIASGHPDARIGINSGFYGDVTGRLGVVWNSALLYAKGGYAFYDGRDKFFQGATSTFTSASQTGLFNGYAVGGGLEYAFARAWSAKIEYLHFGFGNQTFNVTIPGSVLPFTEHLTVDTVKVGVNYRFGTP